MSVDILSWNNESWDSQKKTSDFGVSQQVQNLITLWWYDSMVEIKEWWVFIDISSLTGDKFKLYVDSIFNSNYYFEWLDDELFSKLILSPSEFQASLKSEVKQIKLCDKILPISPERAAKYHKPMIFWTNKDQAEYTFNPLFDEEVGEWGRMVEIRNYLNKDEFIARMWIHGVRFWFQIEAIKEAIQAPKDKKVVIAEALPIVPGKDAYLQTLIPLWQDLGIQTTVTWKIDWKDYARVFPQIPEWQRLYQKVNLVEGKKGMNIAWVESYPIPPKDIHLKDLCGEWVVLINEKGIEYIVSAQSWYVQPVIWQYDSKEYWETEGIKVKVSKDQIKWPVAVTKEIKLGTIWPRTWNIEAKWDVSIQWEIKHDYWVKAENLTCIWDVSGSIYVAGNIKIIGNILGTAGKQSIKIGQYSQNGQVVSQSWDITINGKVLSNAIIQAQHGNVDATWVESSILIGKNIRVKSLTSSIVIWENIDIDEVKNSIIICSEKTSIKSLVSLKQYWNIILIIKQREYKAESEKVALQIQSITENATKISNKIESLQQKKLQIKEDQRVLEIINIRNKQRVNQPITDSEKRKLEEGLEWYITRVKDFQVTESELKKLSDLFAQHTQALEKLWSAFEQLKKLQETTIKQEVNVALNQSQTKLCHVMLPNFSSFSELTQETLSQLIDYKDTVQNKIFPVELLSDYSEWERIRWIS